MRTTNVSTITYENFGQNTTSRLITQIGNLWVALARNPYGSHNKVGSNPYLLLFFTRGE